METIIKEAVEILKNSCPKAISIKTSILKTEPVIGFIRIDALKECDYPNNISENSIFMEFKIENNKVEYNGGGHVWISPYDKENEFKYYAMRGIRCIALEGGVKKMRKSTFKNSKDLANKLSKTFNETMNVIEKYTGGYPYKNGILTNKLGE